MIKKFEQLPESVDLIPGLVTEVTPPTYNSCTSCHMNICVS